MQTASFRGSFTDWSPSDEVWHARYDEPKGASIWALCEEPYGKEQELVRRERPVIPFSFHPVAPTRMVVWVKCLEPALNDYLELLLEMAHIWPEVREYLPWLPEPERQAKAKRGTTIKTQEDTHKAVGGRPRSADYDWAYQQLEEGRVLAEVYAEWFDRPENQKRDLADPLDSLKQAMRYRRKRGEKRE